MGDKSNERKYRIGIILSSIKLSNSEDRVIFEEKLTLEIMEKFNISLRTAKSYLTDLEIRGAIVRYAGEVWDKEAWDRIGNILTENRTLKDPEEELMLREKALRIKDEDIKL